MAMSSYEEVAQNLTVAAIQRTAALAGDAETVGAQVGVMYGKIFTAVKAAYVKASAEDA